MDFYKIDVKPDGIIYVNDPAGLAGDVELVNFIQGRRVYFISGHFDILKMRFNGHMVMMILHAVRIESYAIQLVLRIILQNIILLIFGDRVEKSSCLSIVKTVHRRSLILL